VFTFLLLSCVFVCVFVLFLSGFSLIELTVCMKQYRQLYDVTIKSVTDSIRLQIVLV